MQNALALTILYLNKLKNNNTIQLTLALTPPTWVPAPTFIVRVGGEKIISLIYPQTTKEMNHGKNKHRSL